jgi:ADP-ribose pyrophosphatase YjhB (NUDIX family)
MRFVIDLAYRLRRKALASLRWPTTGVKVIVYDAVGRLLLIRNRYGRTDLWVLPGGGVKRREALADAAIREVLEETRCAIVAPVPVASYRSAMEGRRDTVHLFHAVTDDHPVADLVEVAEVRFFAADALPPQLSPATRRRIDEVAGRSAITGIW